MIALGTNIREQRSHQGLSQEQLAYELGVSPQTISRWENRVTYPDVTMLPILAEFFGITIDQLVGYAKECPTDEREALFRHTKSLPTSEKLRLLREKVAQYPSDDYLLFALAGALYVQWQQQQDAAVEHELTLLCSRLESGSEPGLACGAMRILALIAARHGDQVRAMQYVNQLPSVCCGREIMAEKVLHDLPWKEAFRRLSENL